MDWEKGDNTCSKGNRPRKNNGGATLTDDKKSRAGKIREQEEEV
jgi:hypothetical protein